MNSTLENGGAAGENGWRRLYLVRHGAAAAKFDKDPDPGLSSLGHDQAAAMAADFRDHAPLPLFVSPLRRAAETAAALARVWQVEAVTEPALAEVPAPVAGVRERGPWLEAFLGQNWAGQPAALHAWREALRTRLLRAPADCVMVSHFVPINAAVGMATADDRVTCFRPDTASVTVLETDGRSLRLVALGRELAGKVL
ncbi:histidine phosphatase family protein [Oceanibacterium hippocampi]|uniref:Bifunctional RNase H/acid phosphatase n=1 Tax=Oceanibacterium hippocampi TaxID=745714 RepID=A0A1Y5SGN1_9PROT|nr:histidine phosphatase family protein [Oceanibacterium hippocampi]SLN38633.1 bifunctional RNase H/acid phosphatase [Oceanibacterium hippocampi]